MWIKQTLFLFPIIFLLSNVGHAAPVEDTGVPVHEEPRHRLVYDKDKVRIINVNVPPGDTTLFHIHSDPTLYVVFSGAMIRAQTYGEEWIQLKPEQIRGTGDLVYREDYVKTPLNHRAQNIDNKPFQVFGVINRNFGNDSTPDARIDAEAEIDNKWFRAYRFKLAAGEKTKTHQHENPVVVVQVNNGNTVVLENDWPTAEKTVGGTWSWHGGKIGHTLKNIGETGVELVEIEVIKN